jgi:hypothetical protein
MLGVELVTDRQLKTPAKDEICHAMEHMKGTNKNYFAFTCCKRLLF